MKITEYRYTHRGETVISLDRLTRDEVKVIVDNRIGSTQKRFQAEQRREAELARERLALIRAAEFEAAQGDPRRC